VAKSVTVRTLWKPGVTAGNVAVVGATGVTGGFAFDELARFGLTPIALGRCVTFSRGEDCQTIAIEWSMSVI
jgi:hypothetical protein